LAVYAGLFFSAFLAATLIPGSSEAALVALLANDHGTPALLVTVATVGNVLGSLVNWLCGRFLSGFRKRPWFPVSARHYDRAIGWYGRFGVWSLLLAWVPIIGDPLTVAAGALRTGLMPFLALVTTGKAARYVAVAVLAMP
jgi:membrane protein YqaA with SNARE-associated domain